MKTTDNIFPDVILHNDHTLIRKSLILMATALAAALLFPGPLPLSHKVANALPLIPTGSLVPVISMLLREDLPASEKTCPDGPLMNWLPVPRTSIQAIMPLGEAGPPNHTLPVHHIYFNLTPLDKGDYGLGSVATPLVSPGAGEIVAIDSNADDQDYNLHIRLCKDVKIYFNHVQSLDAGLLQEIGDINISNSMAIGSSLIKEVSIPLSPGQLIGVVAGPGITSFDMGLIDSRQPQQAYIRPERYSATAVLAEAFNPPPANFTLNLFYNVIPRRLYQFCPIDYFAEPEKIILEKKFAAYMGETLALGNPKCQTHMRDVVETFSGAWFVAENGSQLLMDEANTFAAIPYSVNPGIEIFSAPINLFPALPYDGRWGFIGTNSGTTNRSFANVMDQQLYCYSGLTSPGTDNTLSGSFLMQLKSAGNSQLTIEYIPSETCATLPQPWSFQDSELTLYR